MRMEKDTWKLKKEACGIDTAHRGVEWLTKHNISNKRQAHLIQCYLLYVCTTFSNLIRATIGQRWSRFREDEGGQESSHRRQNILPITPKSTSPGVVTARPEHPLSGPNTAALFPTPSLLLMTRHVRLYSKYTRALSWLRGTSDIFWGCDLHSIHEEKGV